MHMFIFSSYIICNKTREEEKETTIGLSFVANSLSDCEEEDDERPLMISSCSNWIHSQTKYPPAYSLLASAFFRHFRFYLCINENIFAHVHHIIISTRDINERRDESLFSSIYSRICRLFCSFFFYTFRFYRYDTLIKRKSDDKKTKIQRYRISWSTFFSDAEYYSNNWPRIFWKFLYFNEIFLENCEIIKKN